MSSAESIRWLVGRNNYQSLRQAEEMGAYRVKCSYQTYKFLWILTFGDNFCKKGASANFLSSTPSMSTFREKV